MPVHCALHHLTSYKYAEAVSLGPQVIRLRPASHSRTEIPAYSLKITPEKHFINWQQDPQGNFLARVVFPEPVREFSIEVDLVADLTTINPFDFFLESSAETSPFTYSRQVLKDLRPYLRKPASRSRLFLEFFDQLPVEEGMKTIDYIVAVNHAVHERIKYKIRLEPGVQSPHVTLSTGEGSCRDSAWLLVQTFRKLGFAARFCSGYLIQLKADQKPVGDGPAGASEDFTDLHAWCEVYLPVAGWVGLDPTSGLLTGEGHIPLSSAAHFENAAPITGSLLTSKKIETDFEFDMSLRRIRETPRVTLPYTAEQTRDIEALGHDLDARLREQDIRLTMGGEPTFVSATDMEADEWNTDALGPTKEIYADQLLRRLHGKFSPGGFLHHGQGKWYPGEPLPRWAFTSYWREDGEPIWKDLSLFADPSQTYDFTTRESAEFSRQLAKNLGVPDKYIRAAFEDVFYYLWKERRLPMNVSAKDPRLDDELERRAIAKTFDRGLGAEVGHLLPLAFKEGWKSEPWFLKDEEFFLAPGNHPMGYRLPLDSLPWAEKMDRPILDPVDPSIPRAAFPAERILPAPLRGARHYDSPRTRLLRQRVNDAPPPPAPVQGESAKEAMRTGLCVEPRDGRLNIFMPPLERAENYLELIGAIEETARSMGTPVKLEGYRPPSDPRLESFSVTPDPGVIEVNIHPSKSWNQIVSRTRTIYDEARELGLGTEKFMEDGRHSGTGGGNHIVLGGETPLDSPFLRKPVLLQSLITYFNNHPALSYLFSGLFIGPTSQAPRIDEARLETMYELETAFSELPKSDTTREHAQWIVDRVLRNHMVDMTGNTHRSEICVDKLFSPGSPTGRLGLVELRGFEMPPHADMSLAQQLLIRGLISRFWDTPYDRPLMRWGTSLHDKWMLPHFIGDDMRDIIRDLQNHGLNFDPAWFDPHQEFRFPLIGEYEQNNLQLELRQAIEPWHVLGEEQTSQGTSRYVDSSVERIQLKVRGFEDPRYRVSCNGVPVPLHPTGTRGEFIAGIRFRAWDPWSALHPTKKINAPLTFDIVDTWNEQSIGGCQYHVVHPGGRAYDDFPLNAFVAESRRKSRFFKLNKTPGKLVVPKAEVNADYPLTLDLQRHPKAAPTSHS